MRGTALLLCALLAGGPAAAQTRIQAENPPVHVWLLGDELVQRVRILLPEGARLDRASLPRPREVLYWLELKSVETREIPGGVEVELRWLNFYAALQTDQRRVPPSPIRILDAQGAAEAASLPGFDFVATPLRPLLERSSAAEMRPDPAYRLIDRRPNQIGAAAALAAVLALAAALAWTQGWPPFHKRRDLPLTKAARRMARLPDAATADLRRALHRGLDGTFGRSLIGADLEAFLAEAPRFRPLGPRLAAFFADSDAAFFAAAAPQEDPAVLRALARDLAALERGRA